MVPITLGPPQLYPLLLSCSDPLPPQPAVSSPSPPPSPPFSPHTAPAPSSPARIPRSTINADPLPSSPPAPSRCPPRLCTITSNVSWCRGGSGGSMAGLSLAAGACNAMNGALRNHWHGHHRRSRQRRSRPLAGFALAVLVVGSFTTVPAPCAMREEEGKCILTTGIAGYLLSPRARVKGLGTRRYSQARQRY